MKVAFACPGCSKSHRAPPEWRGKRAKCDDCGMRFVVPEIGLLSTDQLQNNQPQNTAPTAVATHSSPTTSNARLDAISPGTDVQLHSHRDTLQFQCEVCSSTIHTPRARVGKLEKCPQCSHPFIVESETVPFSGQDSNGTAQQELTETAPSRPSADHSLDTERQAAEDRVRQAITEREAAEERLRKAEAAQKTAEEKARRAKAEAAKKAAEERIRKARAEAERKAAEERARKARIEAEQRAAQEKARKAAQEKAAAEKARRAKVKAEHKAAEERARQFRAEAERKAAEERARKAKAEAERKAAVERARKAKAETERKAAAERARKAKAAADHCRDCEPLLQLATSHIYRNNLFRVLGLPVDSTSRDVKRQEDRRKLQEKLGIAAADGPNGPLALTPPPSNDDARLAVERLNRPLDRVLHEVFWLWPTSQNGTPDSAIRAAANGELDQAVKQWEQAAQVGQDELAIHNLAILDHMTALDREIHPSVASSYARQENDLDVLWSRAFESWRRVLAGEQFWSALKARARAIDDVTLTTGVVRRIRATLPMAILLINARLACTAVEQSDLALAQRHIKLMRTSGFDDHFVEEAVREALKPARNRIKAATDNASDGWKQAPHRGNQYVRECYAQVKHLLKIVDALLPNGDVTRRAIHDTVAEALLQGQVAFGNKTNDWAECVELLSLAQELACGDSTRSKLSQNLDILQQNAKGGNDWYTRGYWDLPEDTVAELEEARAKAKSGDLKGALQVVLVLDRAIGKPLKRCVALCLNGRGWQIARAGMDEFTSPTSKLRNFLEVIGRRGSVSAPSPHMSPWQLPDCPSCGRSSYTSWANGEYNGQPFWMCSTCSASDDEERAAKKRKLQKKISEGLEYVLLAAELDESDPGIRKDLSEFEKLAREVGARVPSTMALKERLIARPNRGVRHYFESNKADQLCYFCRENAPDDSCQIRLPMCGDARPVNLLFGEGTKYRYGDLVVPRCRRCRDEHRELPDRTEQWHDARLAASDSGHFPNIMEEFASTGKVAREAVAAVSQKKKEATDAQAGVDKAFAIEKICDQCRTKKRQTDGCLCRKCDRDVFNLSAPSKLGIAAIITVALILVFAFDSFPAGAGVLFSAVVLTVVLMLRQSQRRRVLAKKRQEEIAQRCSAAKHRADQAMAALASAEEAAQGPVMAHEDAKKKLESARQLAIAEFEKAHPKPQLGQGVGPESSYSAFERIVELRAAGWFFGHEWNGDRQAGSDRPVNVIGLVGSEPNVVVGRVFVGCPKCDKPHSVAVENAAVKVRCSCGNRFTCFDGKLKDLSESDRMSARPARGRDGIRALAKHHDREEMIDCPICQVSVKAKNLVRHFDQNHQGQDVPDITIK